MSDLNRPIYLDNHATTRVDPRVVDAMLPFFTENFGNAASVNHSFGWEASKAVETAREQIGQLFNADADAFVFTSGATEANNLALKGVMNAAGAGAHLILNAAEHPSVIDPAQRLKRSGFEVTILPVNQCGTVDPDDVNAALRPETVLVSVMTANNEIGSINPIAKISEICRENQVLFHTDSVQAAGRIPVDLQSTPVDLLSVSAHKIYGPKGVGALYVRRGSPRISLEPLIDGGGHERHLRSGTLPVPLIVGFGKACQLAKAELTIESTRIAELRDRLWTGLNESLNGLHLNGHRENRLPGNLNVSFEDVDGEALMTGLTSIAVSSGSACTSANPEPSHVLRAIGRNDQLTRSSLRFGIGRFNTLGDVEHAVQAVIAVVERLRKSRSSRND
jgi:cysteine desulfurase